MDNFPVTCDAPINDLHLLKDIKRYSTVSKLVLLQPWQSFKTAFRMLDPNWCHFLCFPVVCQRTRSATLSTVCVKHMIQKYSGMSEIWKQTSHMIYPQQSWVACLTAHPYLPSVLLVNDFHLVIISTVHTYEVHQLCFCRLSQFFVHWLISDAADRSITLMSQFNQSITTDEAEMQTLLQVFADTQDGCRTPAGRHWKPLVFKHTEIWPASIWISK